VTRPELFGSATSVEKFRPDESDLDFLVEFDRTNGWGRYFGLMEDAEALFGRHVDLVETSAIKNPYFLEAVIETRILLYAV
jgi:predicted nucleotidyltransferase